MTASTFGGFRPRKKKKKPKRQLAQHLGITKKEARVLKEEIEQIVSGGVTYKLIYKATQDLSSTGSITAEEIADLILKDHREELAKLQRNHPRNRASSAKQGTVEEQLQPLLDAVGAQPASSKEFVKLVLSQSKAVKKLDIVPAVKRMKRRGFYISPVTVSNWIIDERKRRVRSPREISTPMGGQPGGRRNRG